jgi:regulator of protease activity HflC (stomatin/prohibitin superfamily)
MHECVKRTQIVNPERTRSEPRANAERTQSEARANAKFLKANAERTQEGNSGFAWVLGCVRSVVHKHPNIR